MHTLRYELDFPSVDAIEYLPLVFLLLLILVHKITLVELSWVSYLPALMKGE